MPRLPCWSWTWYRLNRFAEIHDEECRLNGLCIPTWLETNPVGGDGAPGVRRGGGGVAAAIADAAAATRPDTFETSVPLDFRAPTSSGLDWKYLQFVEYSACIFTVKTLLVQEGEESLLFVSVVCKLSEDHPG